MFKQGVKVKKDLRKTSLVRLKGYYNDAGYVPGRYRPIKDYLRIMLSRIQGDAFDLEAFNATFESVEWRSLCDPINMQT